MAPLDARIVQPFFIEDDLGLDETAAAASGNACAVADELRRVFFAAARAAVAVDRAVQLIDAAAPRLLVQTVDILRDDGAELSLAFQRCKRQMRGVRLCFQRQHFLTVEAVKFLGVAVEKAVT